MMLVNCRVAKFADRLLPFLLRGQVISVDKLGSGLQSVTGSVADFSKLHGAAGRAEASEAVLSGGA
jgi:hypothetical protein